MELISYPGLWAVLIWQGDEEPEVGFVGGYEQAIEWQEGASDYRTAIRSVITIEKKSEVAA